MNLFDLPQYLRSALYWAIHEKVLGSIIDNSRGDNELWALEEEVLDSIPDRTNLVSELFLIGFGLIVLHSAPDFITLVLIILV